MIIDGVFKSNNEQIEEYQAELRKCMYSDGNGGMCIRFCCYSKLDNELFCICFRRSCDYNVLCAER